MIQRRRSVRRGTSFRCCRSTSLAIAILCMLLLAQPARGQPALDQYLYLKESPESVYPIIEIPTNSSFARPDFLYDPDFPHPRIVEFYAHWCPHCQHFKPHYVEFARTMRAVNVDFQFYAVSCVPYKSLCNDFKIRGYPSLRLFPAKSINGTDLPRNQLHPSSILQQLGLTTDVYPSKYHGGVGDALPGAVNTKPHFLARSIRECYQDAHLSLDFLLRNGVYMAAGALGAKAAASLIHFLQVCSRVLPASSSIHQLIQGLLLHSQDIVKSDLELVHVLEGLDVSPPVPSWSEGCLQHGTGYTCGLWTLFHIVTVGTVEWNRGAGDPELRIPTLEVADSIRNLIEHFFQCDECRLHFLQEYDACGHDRCNRLTMDLQTIERGKELVLWLYETHNGVNVRLRGEQISNGERVDTESDWQVQWPSIEQCPTCWLSDGRWDEDRIYQFMRLQYWPEDYMTKDFQSSLRVMGGGGYLHPDVVSVLEKENRHVSMGLPQSYGSSFFTVPIFLLAAVGGYWYRRKRKYDEKGYHKKRESFSDC